MYFSHYEYKNYVVFDWSLKYILVTATNQALNLASIYADGTVGRSVIFTKLTPHCHN